MFTEVWKPVKNREQYYEVSSYGRIRNKESGRILKPSTSGHYLHVSLRYGANKECLIHRLVATAFVPNPNNFNVVNHIDENRLNNHADNLEWCSSQYNVTYGKMSHIRNTKVIQCDMDGNVLKEWESIKDAEIALGIKYQGISKCCRGEGKSSGGFTWKYADPSRVRRWRKEKETSALVTGGD